MKLKYFLPAIIFLFCIATSVFLYYRFDSSLLTRLSFYIELANPYVKIVRVEPGLRSEQVANIVGNKLNWDDQEKQDFINSVVSIEGHYFPSTYLLDKDAGPSEVAETMNNEFSKEVSKVKKGPTMQIINQNTAIKIASIIQRESGGKSDMNLISGIIWNRIFNGMKLQIDATLQYAKGNAEDGWWGPVASADKNIESSYNTYLYNGLPPGPISNPSLDAISAAYNPSKTSCIFYIHDKKHKIHCSATYAGQLKNIQTYLK